MTAIRDTLCKLQPVEIPRPKCTGLQFVSTRGRYGFYQSIKRDGEKYGIQIKNPGPRRPSLPDPWMNKNNNKTDNQHLSSSVNGDHSYSLASTSVKPNMEISDYNGNYSTLHSQSPKAQNAIPEEPEDDFFEVPKPDYEDEIPVQKETNPNKNSESVKNQIHSERIACPIPNPPPAPPLPTSLKKPNNPKTSIQNNNNNNHTVQNNNNITTQNSYKNIVDQTNNNLQKSNFYFRQCQDVVSQKNENKSRTVQTKF